MHTHVLPAGTTGRAPLAVDVSPESLTIEVTGSEGKVDAMLEAHPLYPGLEY